MKRATTLILVGTVLGCLLGCSAAGGAYNAPGVARVFLGGMVTAYNECTAPSLTHKPPLSGPACAPVQSSATNPANVYTFGTHQGLRSGSARFGFTPGTGSQGHTPRGDASANLSANTIWKNGALYAGNDLQLMLIVRMTDNGCGAVFDLDCTTMDLPLPVGLICKHGSCNEAATSLNAALPGSLHQNDRTIVGISQIAIFDEDGDTFARQGLRSGLNTDVPGFNAPKLTGSSWQSLVPAYDKCTAPSMTHRPALALPACSPAPSSANDPAHVYTFGDPTSDLNQGSAKVVISSGSSGPYEDISGGDIYKDGTLYTGSDLSATAVLRVTDRGCGDPPYGVACTRPDFPLTVGLTCIKGRCKGPKMGWNTIVPNGFQKSDDTSIEIRSFAVTDEDGDPVMTPGIFVK